MTERRFGIQDVPINRRTEDSLGLDKYAVALAQFIASCPTPISVGIQGDWGLGKTSLMQLVAAYLEEHAGRSGQTIKTYWVNTWQLSQFDLGDRLPITLLQNLVSKIAVDSKLKSSLVEKLKVFAIQSGRFLGHLANHQVADNLGLDVKAVMAGANNAGEMLESMKTDFETLCKNACENKGEDARLVFFIDDLDRLLPERAVEVMEVMKNFLDVPHTVFVLACDYQVVVKGLEAKFKVGIKDLGGRSFFDKIIQVPFRMPRQAYRMEEHLTRILGSSHFPIHERISEYVDLVRYSFGFNPRAIKRHCNTLQLLRLVMEQHDDQKAIASDPYKLKLLFASLCLEAEYPALYAWLAEQITAGELRARLAQLASPDRVREIAGESASALAPDFARVFQAVVDQDRDGALSEAEAKTLQAVLNVSAIASLAEHAPEQGYGRFVESFLGACSSAIASSIRQLLAATPVDQGYTFHRMRGERVIQAFHPRWGYCLWFENPEDEPDVVRVFLNAAPGDPVRKAAPEHTYADALQQLGYDSHAELERRHAGWREGKLAITWDTQRAPQLDGVLPRVMSWYFSLDE